MKNKSEADEIAYMKRMIASIEDSCKAIDNVLLKNYKDLREYKEYLWNNLSELDRAEKSTVRNNVSQTVVSAEAMMEKKKRLQRLASIPFFGRIDFKEDGQNEELPVYIGLYSYHDAITKEVFVHDWRTPISSMFYDYERGRASYQAPYGQVSGEINLKRQYRIRHSVLEYMLESSVNIGDDILQKELSVTSDERMKNIVATIQREQNKIIRDEDAYTLIIQGVAGSGKTSIALHRVAYILYKFTDITSRDILIVSPNKVFSDYISNVLPELGEEQIEECGMEELMSKYLQGKHKFQTFFEQVSSLLEDKDDAFAERIKFKATYDFTLLLDKFVVFIENNYFAPVDARVGRIPVPKEYIKEKFESYHRMPIRNRFDFIAKDIINEIQIRSGQDITTVERNALKRDIKAMFLYKNDIDLYKKFYEWIGKPELFVMKKKVLEYADVAPLLYLKLAMEGVKDQSKMKHLLVDEMQDYTPIQYKVLNKLFPCRKTILGDARQSVNPLSSTTCDDIRQILGGEVMKLCKSYRSTFEITSFAQSISADVDAVAIERHGDAPKVFKCKDEKDEEEQILKLTKEFEKSNSATMGIVCKTKAQARKLYDVLSPLSTHIALIDEECFSFSSGIVIITAHMAKGLEFDEVVVPMVSLNNYHNEIDKGMLYIACTRAMHKLFVTYSGKASSFLPKTV